MYFYLLVSLLLSSCHAAHPMDPLGYALGTRFIQPISLATPRFARRISEERYARSPRWTLSSSESRMDFIGTYESYSNRYNELFSYAFPVPRAGAFSWKRSTWRWGIPYSNRETSYFVFGGLGMERRQVDGSGGGDDETKTFPLVLNDCWEFGISGPGRHDGSWQRHFQVGEVVPDEGGTSIIQTWDTKMRAGSAWPSPRAHGASSELRILETEKPFLGDGDESEFEIESFLGVLLLGGMGNSTTSIEESQNLWIGRYFVEPGAFFRRDYDWEFSFDVVQWNRSKGSTPGPIVSEWPEIWPNQTTASENERDYFHGFRMSAIEWNRTDPLQGPRWVVFGGIVSDRWMNQSEAKNDVVVIEWHPWTMEYGETPIFKHDVVTLRETSVPVPRGYHAQWSFREGNLVYLFVYGGEFGQASDGSLTRLNDFWTMEIDLLTMEGEWYSRRDGGPTDDADTESFASSQEDLEVYWYPKASRMSSFHYVMENTNDDWSENEYGSRHYHAFVMYGGATKRGTIATFWGIYMLPDFATVLDPLPMGLHTWSDFHFPGDKVTPLKYGGTEEILDDSWAECGVDVSGGSCLPQSRCDAVLWWNGETVFVYGGSRNISGNPTSITDLEGTMWRFEGTCAWNLVPYYVVVFFLIVVPVVCVCVVCVAVIVVILCVVRMKRKADGTDSLDRLLLKENKDEEKRMASLTVNESLFELNYDDLKMIKSIGRGGSNAIIFLAEWQGKEVAFKCFNTSDICTNAENFSEFEREVSILASVAHPNVLTFYGATLKPPRVGIVMEYCALGDLAVFLQKRHSEGLGRFDLSEKVRILKEVAGAMAYLHSRKDLKSENVLLTDQHVPKIIDFGLSRAVDRISIAKTQRVGTSYYMAPEVCLGGDYRESCDVFSYAVVAWEVLTECFQPYGPIPAANLEQKVANNPEYRPNVTQMIDVVDPDALYMKDLVIRCWNHDPVVRPSFDEIYAFIGAAGKGELAQQQCSETKKDEESSGDLMAYGVDEATGQAVPPNVEDV